MIHGVVFHSSQNQTNPILFLGIFRVGVGMDKRTTIALGRHIVHGSNNHQHSQSYGTGSAEERRKPH
jgi:hypothetical protein